MRAAISSTMTCAALLLLSGCSGDGGSPAEGSPAADSSAAAASTSQAPATTPLSGPDAVVTDWPAEAPAEPGAEQWAVYLAVGPEGDPALTEAAEFLRAHGYSADENHLLACDGGAPETFLGSNTERAVAVYFEWRADAGDFLTLLKPPGAQPEQFVFVDMLRITRDCV
ncbi:hypothetical protein [Blastococcus brunescens]|uniref:LytR/CpsA/Psr regulator C-terminal domain-containing protein n=1 Tax=Blastococcus brunescens TaxID=1564165 RepID=A0ABZ1B0W3_9ACTN|nr:hypothetical protein [Blastococcus sp. BMG 8361]WRL64455.1 hypothetical protein U6N30_00970 [Blastococcus sp. BMG 8361]